MKHRTHSIRNSLLGAVAVLMIAFFCIAGWYGIKGYQMYQQAVKETPIEEIGERLHNNKNFTYYDDMKKYVMTRFYEFQWDLNYANPHVFNKIVEVLLTLANKGIDIFRLDAIPYMWKELGTNCMNHKNVHTLLKMMYCIIQEVCPSVIFLGEAIIEPKEIVKYFGTAEEKECNVMYNASLMVLLWNSIATRDVRLMERSLSKKYDVPDGAVWINYARCHDDIGWGFEQDILREIGFDPEAHKQFMIQFMEGKFYGSFSVTQRHINNL